MPTGPRCVRQRHQQRLSEPERRRSRLQQLPNAVQELDPDGSFAGGFARVAEARSEAVAAVHPFLLDQDLRGAATEARQTCCTARGEEDDAAGRWRCGAWVGRGVLRG
eukprot:3470377-Rhodomonas_salina.1